MFHMEPSADWLTSSVSSPAFSSTAYSDVINSGRKSRPKACAKQAMPSSWIHSCQMLLLNWWIVVVVDVVDRESNDEGTTWREFALVLLMSLLVKEKSLGGVSSYKEGKDKYPHHRARENLSNIGVNKNLMSHLSNYQLEQFRKKYILTAHPLVPISLVTDGH